MASQPAESRLDSIRSGEWRAWHAQSRRNPARFPSPYPAARDTHDARTDRAGKTPSPSTHYRPNFGADSPEHLHYQHLQSRIPHPDALPEHPAATRLMTPEQAAASTQFRNDYVQRREAAQAKDTEARKLPGRNTWDESQLHEHEDNHTHTEMGRTYRREGNTMAPNGDGPHFGKVGEPELPNRPGTFPADTTQMIHSHPRDYTHAPSPRDQVSLFEKRTNALNRPGTDVCMGMVYHPEFDSFMGYDGGIHRGPRVEGRLHPGEPYHLHLVNPYEMSGSAFHPADPNAPIPVPLRTHLKPEFRDRLDLPRDPRPPLQ